MSTAANRPAAVDRSRLQRVVVAGLATSGVAAAEVLLREGAVVTVVESRAGEAEQQRAAALESLGARVLLAQPPDAELPDAPTLVVTSPGWRPDHPLLRAAAAADIPIWGEVELAWRLRDPQVPWLALTGTNGKTTTVRMLAAILTAAGLRATAAGNVGTPLVSVTVGPGAAAYDALAVELSSFQLHWTTSLRPHAAAVLNVAPDHLDWHGSLAAYALDKHRIWQDPVNRAFLVEEAGRWTLGATLLAHDTPRIPVAVGNADDDLATMLLGGAYTDHRVGFTLGPPAVGQLGLVEGLLVDRAFVTDPVGAAEELAAVSDIPLAGPHNVANALAAAGLARSLGVPAAAVRAGLRATVADPHRNATVGQVAGVNYVDDSKATNPHAAAASLAAYPSVVWIAGGLAKGLDVDDLVVASAGRLRAAVLLGADRARFAAALARHAPHVPVLEVASVDTGAMTEVVRAAASLARPGDTVLLAPACASMDMFPDYRARGTAFAAAVRRVAEDAR